MPRVRVNGVPLHHERSGSGEPLLLITGFTISAAVFEPVLDLYARALRVITYDNRGSGRSGAPLRPTSMAELAADAAGLLRELGVESAHVCGLSMGGMIAQELAIRFPERVRGLVLGGTTPGGPRAARPTLRELGALGARRPAGGATASARGWASGCSPRRSGASSPSGCASCCATSAATAPTPQGVWAHWWASVYHDTTSRLRCIQAPTLVMHGEQDAMAPISNARLLAERIPDAELCIVPGAGHAYMLERPEASFELLCELARPRARRSRPERRARAPPRAPSRSRARSACRSAPPGRARAWPA